MVLHEVDGNTIGSVARLHTFDESKMMSTKTITGGAEALYADDWRKWLDRELLRNHLEYGEEEEEEDGEEYAEEEYAEEEDGEDGEEEEDEDDRLYPTPVMSVMPRVFASLLTEIDALLKEDSDDDYSPVEDTEQEEIALVELSFELAEPYTTSALHEYVACDLGCLRNPVARCGLPISPVSLVCVEV